MLIRNCNQRRSGWHQSDNLLPVPQKLHCSALSAAYWWLTLGLYKVAHCSSRDDCRLGCMLTLEPETDQNVNTVLNTITNNLTKNNRAQYQQVFSYIQTVNEEAVNEFNKNLNWCKQTVQLMHNIEIMVFRIQIEIQMVYSVLQQRCHDDNKITIKLQNSAAVDRNTITDRQAIKTIENAIKINCSQQKH